ncbi:MAG TPA: rhomboid family intramembrane serine protease [Caulifigura sp.]|jgi:GlpG protein|nr:rhomboid family intramembrane serine protease [Caulifigura sp.]
MGYLRGLADLPRNPPVTTGAVFLCIALFLLANHNLQFGPQQALESVGWRGADVIWHGQWWPLLTSAVIHLELWHVAFNIYWLWILGGRLELRLGSLRYLAFTVAAAFVTSSLQLAVSGQTGIGYSGINYAIFGLMWQARASDPEFQRALPLRTRQLFILWMFGCLFMTFIGAVDIANTAHFSGLIFGCLAAPVLTKSKLKPLCIAGLCLSVVISVASLCWAPWNAYWLADRGYHAHLNEQYVRAINYYDAALKLDRHLPGIAENRALALQTLEAQRQNERAQRIAPDAPTE